MALLRLPGLIDPHVHLREPGSTAKEDFFTGTRAAVAGGFTYVIDMPNNPGAPTISLERLAAKIALADAKAFCDVGFHYGTDGHNQHTFRAAAANPRVHGLKIYCNHTTGSLLVQDPHVLDAVVAAWESPKPILVHAEGAQMQAVLRLAARYGRRLHICHVSQASEVGWIREAKALGQEVTAGVCPHHLWLTNYDRLTLRGYAVMKPPLGTDSDQRALWTGLQDGSIDLVETDHAPHTRPEKEDPNPAFGVTGLETCVGLMCKASRAKRLPLSSLSVLLHERAAAIFQVPRQPDTYIEVDPDESYVIEPPFQTKCDWSPFEGWEACGRPQTVVLRGRVLVRGGSIIC